MQRWLERQGAAEHDIDRTPVEMPSDMDTPRTLEEVMGQMLATRLAQLTEEQGFDSWEEANDFEDTREGELLNFTRFELDDLDEPFGDPLDPDNPHFAHSPAEHEGEATEIPPADAEPSADDSGSRDD